MSPQKQWCFRFVFSPEFPHSLDYCEKRKLNTHQRLSPGERGSCNSASHGKFINILKYFGLSQLGSTTEIQDGKNTDKHPKTQKLLSIPNANRAEVEKPW